jgi:hypothetical protein
MLCKLVKEADAFGLALARDRIGSALGHRAAAAKAWMDRCRAVVADINAPGRDDATLEACQRAADRLAEEAEQLCCNVTRDVEKLRVSCCAQSCR